MAFMTTVLRDLSEADTFAFEDRKSSGNQVIRAEVSLDAHARAVGTVSANMFGAVVQDSSGYHDFRQDADYMGVTALRFPGGTITEDGEVTSDGRIVVNQGDVTFHDLQEPGRAHIAYDLTFPELVNPDVLAMDQATNPDNEIATLSEIFEDAITHNASAGITLPTERYMEGLNLGNPADLARSYAQITQDLEIFLGRLKSGAFNGGQYPMAISFVIGNENYADPIGYALVAARMMDVINRELDGSGINFKFSIQMGTGSSNWMNVLSSGNLDRYFDARGHALIPQLGGTTMQQLESLGYDDRILAFDKLLVAVLGERVTDVYGLRHHFLQMSEERIHNAPILEQRDAIVDFWRDEITRHGGDPSQAI
jgi:hypothetical protein